MNPEVLAKVLECRRLPTLPAVAMRVIELTNNANVSMKALAETIQNDQALAAKILRTANSSLFCLRRKCASINQAIVMLGLSAVKTLALGFTLVGAIKDAADESFDLAEHWRRALYTAIGARALAAHAKAANPEECFLGGLLQDVGMIALHQALGQRYLDIIASAGGDHRAVARAELRALQTQHPEVGALLATKWRLPDALVMPVKYHERPTAAPREHQTACRAVGLANIAADILCGSRGAEDLRRFYRAAESWFGMSESAADEVLRQITHQTREVASLLSVPTAQVADGAQVVEEARRRLAEIRLPEGADPLDLGGETADPDTVDELTGAASRMSFDRSLVAMFEQARSGGHGLALALFALDDLARLRAEGGTDAADTVLIAVAGRIARALGEHRPLIARYAEDTFAVMLGRTDRSAAVRLAEAARVMVTDEPVKLIAAKAGAPPAVQVSVNVGLAVIEGDLVDRIDDPGELTQVVERAVAAARRAGGNVMRIYTPGPARAAA